MEKLSRYLISGYSEIEREILDLDLRAIIEKVDYCTSSIGKQLLCYKIYNSIKNDSSPDFQASIKLNRNAAYYEKGLKHINKTYNFDMADIVFGDLKINKHWSFKYAPYILVLILICLIGLKFEPLFFTLLLTILFGLTVFIYFISKGIILSSKNFLLNVSDFSKACNVITRHDDKIPFKVKKNNFTVLIKILTVEDSIEKITPVGLIASTCIEIIKAVFLIDSIIITTLISRLDLDRENLKNDYFLLGQIDFNLALIKLKEEEKDKICIPSFNTSEAFYFDSLTHPLIDKCVSNSIAVKEKVIMITGSNMAGKSTFIKAVAVNIILGKALKICYAKSANLLYHNILSSIKINDNLAKAKSYFNVELDIISTIIEESKNENSIIFLDEPFKGTNSTERIALNVAVIKYLHAKNNKLVLTTHDVKLYDFIKDISTPFHFNLNVNTNDVFFDYKLKEGVIKNYYAINILKSKNFPESVIEDSLSVMSTLRDEI